MCKCMIVKASNGHQQEYKILIVPLCSLWFSTFAMLFWLTRSLVGHRNTERWLVHCYQDCCFEILRDFFCIIIHDWITDFRIIYIIWRPICNFTPCILRPSVSSQNGNTALIIASSKGHTRVVMKLLQAGATVNIANKVAYAVMWLAAL